VPLRYVRFRCAETGRVCFLDERGQNYWCPYHGDHKLVRTHKPVEIPRVDDLLHITEDDLCEHNVLRDDCVMCRN